MIEVKSKGNLYEIKNRVEEISTKEYSLISDIFEKENYTTVDKYLESLKVLGLPKEVVDSIGSTALINAIKALKWFDKLEGLPRVIELDNKTYELYEEGEEYDLPAATLSKIEAAIKKGKGVSHVMALVLGLEPTEENLKLIDELPANLTAPYFAWMHINISENINEFISNEVGGI
jgi:hypothetical protein